MFDKSTKIFPFILSGGSGTRLWPLSRSSYPKQFLEDLIDGPSLLKQSVQRISGDAFQLPSVICNNDHRFLVAEQLREIDTQWDKIILEPVARNTAPAAITAALSIIDKNDDALVLLMPSDHVIPDISSFQETVKLGVPAALEGNLVTLGVTPDAPETGYGYIETIPNEGDIYDVRRFVEKPNKEVAQTYLDTGNFFWNAGIFLYSARAMLKAFEEHSPNTLNHCREALEKAQTDLDFLRLNEEAFAACENISIDYAIMEKADNIKCVPLNGAWSDLGAWPAIWKHMNKNALGNVTRGDVLLKDVKDSYVHSADGACVAVIGLDNVMTIATKDAVLVASKENAGEVRDIVAQLKERDRDEADTHTRVYRPWGWYEGLSLGERFQVKCLMVKPNAQLSLQSHMHRAEHWVVVSGTAEVTIEDKVSLLTENQSTYIPLGAKHRLKNPGKVPALLIEVQSGSYLGEDDIIRYQDDFGRN